MQRHVADHLALDLGDPGSHRFGGCDEIAQRARQVARVPVEFVDGLSQAHERIEIGVEARANDHRYSMVVPQRFVASGRGARFLTVHQKGRGRGQW